MKKLSSTFKSYRISLILSLVFFLGIQVRSLGQPVIDFNSTADGLTACQSGNFTTDFTLSSLDPINGNACPSLSIKSIQLQLLVDNASLVCTNCPLTTILGLTFPASSNSASYTISGPIAGDGSDHVIIFTLKATQSDDKSRQKTFRLHITSAGTIGDPHITTVGGVHYDFQSVGEFVTLRSDNPGGFEIQTRHTAVSTSGPGSAFNNTTNLSTCVSVNTAIAMRVGTHRVTYQPNINGQPDSSGMQLRIDGQLTQLGNDGIDLGSGGRILKSAAGGGVIEIDFPDGATLIVTPSFWVPYSQWYLNVDIANTVASKGLMGAIPPRSWLPALPDGSSVGPMPVDSPHQRFVTLYTTFADAWRVTDQTSLFDYAPGDSTKTFTNKSWPVENPQSCTLPAQTPMTPITLLVAQQVCRDITDPNLKADAIMDVMVTGDSAFAKTYLLTQHVKKATVATLVKANKDTTKSGEAVIFTATVARIFSKEKGLSGSVEFIVDGTAIGQVNLDTSGHAVLTTDSLSGGEHQVAVRYIPDANSTGFASSSRVVIHTVISESGITGILHKWWFWLIVLLIIIIIIVVVARKKKP